MKIALISIVGGSGWAGSEEVLKKLAMEAISNGHQISISLPFGISKTPELNDIILGGGAVFGFKHLNGLTRRLSDKGIYSRFENIERWNPDFICVSGVPAALFWHTDLGLLLTKTKAKKVLLMQANHEGHVVGENQREALREIFGSADKNIFVSHENAKMLERQLAMKLKNVTIIHPPLREPVDSPLAWPQENGSKVRFATVARYDVSNKCQDQTLDALSSPEWLERDWILDLFGRGGDEKYLKDLISYYNLTSRVNLCGHIQDFRDIWTTHHLHILNSHAEGLTMGLIESMSCGRPAVITRAGGNYDLLRDGIDGFVSPGVHPEIIRQTLEKAWHSMGRWEEMGLSASKRARDYISNNVGRDLLKAIQS
jgi:glycosyltransferase involved in cell wall biosynthesis